MDLSKHPCFNDDIRHQFGRIHLPVAPKCNVQCNFCDRQFSCVNESRPGVTTTVLSPAQAHRYLGRALYNDSRIAVVGIAGPGDPMANPDETLETLHRVRDDYPDLLLCLATNGLNLPTYVEQLAELGVSHVTITVNAVDPTIGAQIYAWIRDGKRPLRGEIGAQLLLDRQLESIRRLRQHDIVTKINSIVIRGVNERHISKIASTVAGLGANVLNAIPMYSVDNTQFESLDPPDLEVVNRIREQAGRFLPLMHHCTRCRADASGLLDESLNGDQVAMLREAASLPLNPNEDRPFVAVATMEGMLVNLHLGEAASLSIFESTPSGYKLVDTRETPDPGNGAERWEQMASTLHDCRAVLATSAGRSPTNCLSRNGIRIVMMEGLIEEGLDAAFTGLAIRAPLRQEHRCGSGAGCSGNGMGCG